MDPSGLTPKKGGYGDAPLRTVGAFALLRVGSSTFTV